MFSNALIYITEKIYGKQTILPTHIIDIIAGYAWEYTEHKHLVKILNKINEEYDNDNNDYSMITRQINKYIINSFYTNRSDHVFLINNLDKINFIDVYDNKKIIKNNEKEIKDLLLKIL